MNVYTLDEAKFILGMVAGRETGFTTPTQVRDAALTVLDHLAKEPEMEYGRLIGEAPYQWLLGSSDISSASHRRMKAIPAGEWVRIAQEGAGDEGDA